MCGQGVKTGGLTDLHEQMQLNVRVDEQDKANFRAHTRVHSADASSISDWFQVHSQFISDGNLEIH